MLHVPNMYIFGGGGGLNYFLIRTLYKEIVQDVLWCRLRDKKKLFLCYHQMITMYIVQKIMTLERFKVKSEWYLPVEEAVSIILSSKIAWLSKMKHLQYV